jgi:Uncharacterised protein family (UPF0160)
MVAALNPSWNEPNTDADRDARFEQASTLMGEQFLKKLDYYGKSWLPARDIVMKALKESESLDPQGRILHLPEFCPWKVPTPTLVTCCKSLTGFFCGRNICLIWRRNEGLLAEQCISCSLIHLPYTGFKLCLFLSIVSTIEKRFLNNGVAFATKSYRRFLVSTGVSLFTQQDSLVETSLLTVLYKWQRKRWKCNSSR